MARQFDKPSRLNAVSFLFFLGLAAAIYVAIQFGPPYYRRWKAAGVVSEYVNKLYADRFRDDIESRLRPELLVKLRELGIDDSTVQATFHKSMTACSIEATYRELVKHPLVGKTTTLEFTLSEEAKKESD